MTNRRPAFIETVRADGGLIFLSHIEERLDHPMTGLDGMEIYNRHADAKKDKAGLLALVLRAHRSEVARRARREPPALPRRAVRLPVHYPADYLAKWDAETHARRLTGVAANDCHHNMVLLVKMVDEATVRVGTNIDRDDEMRTVTANLRPRHPRDDEGSQAGRHPGAGRSRPVSAARSGT